MGRRSAFVAQSDPKAIISEQTDMAPKWLDEKEQLTLLRVVRKANNQRDFAMIQLLRRTGLRVSELVDLRLDDIRLGEMDRHLEP